jgi:hypothetical protein
VVKVFQLLVCYQLFSLVSLHDWLVWYHPCWLSRLCHHQSTSGDAIADVNGARIWLVWFDWIVRGGFFLEVHKMAMCMILNKQQFDWLWAGVVWLLNVGWAVLFGLNITVLSCVLMWNMKPLVSARWLIHTHGILDANQWQAHRH